MDTITITYLEFMIFSLLNVGLGWAIWLTVWLMKKPSICPCRKCRD